MGHNNNSSNSESAAAKLPQNALSTAKSGRGVVMNWKSYEDRIHEHFTHAYPKANVRKNQYILGKYSKAKRQIDVLIEETIGTTPVRTIVDGKFFNRKVDVTKVEAFASFVADVGAQRGILVTSRGYSKAALERAFNDSRKLELDILNFDDLQQFQALVALPYVDDNTVVVPAPLGWVIDGDKQGPFHACAYQRGLDLAAAQKRMEWMYMILSPKGRGLNTIDDLISFQNSRTKKHGQGGRTTYLNPTLRDDALTKIRCTRFRDPKFYEITGFVPFDKFIFFCVVITPANRKAVNLRKLEYVLAKIMLVNVKRDNTQLIAQLKQKKESAVDPSVKSSLAREIAHYYRDMGMSEEAIPYLEESAALGLHYQGARDLLRLIIRHRPIEQVIVATDRHLQLAPENPTVYNDIVDLCSLENRTDLLPALFTALKARNPSNSVICGNLDFYMADSLIADGDFARAADFLRTSHQQLSTCLPKDHTVFKLIRKMETICEKKSLSHRPIKGKKKVGPISADA